MRHIHSMLISACKRSGRMRILPLLMGMCLCATSAPAAEPLLETLPADAIAAIQINRPQRLLPREKLQALCAAIIGNESAGGKLANAITKLPGGLAIGILEGDARGGRVNSSITLDLRGLQGDIDTLINSEFLPAIAILQNSRGRTFELDNSARIRRIISQPGPQTVFAYATRDNLLFGCTKPGIVSDWLRGEWPQRRLVDKSGVRRSIARASGDYAVRAILNPEFTGLLNRRQKPAPNSWGELLDRIYPAEEIESILAEIEWQKSALTIRLDVAFAQKCEGLVKIITQPPTSSSHLGMLAADYPLVGRIGFRSVQSIVEGVYALTDRFDPEISLEYREDLAEFKSKTGCDWAADILGNLSGEVAFGVRADFTKMPPVGWAAICPLADEAKFSAAIEKLITHFGLAFQEERRESLLIRRAGQLPMICMCISRNRLILADSSQTIARIAASQKDDQIKSVELRKFYQSLGEQNQAAMLVDVAQLAATTPLAMMAPPTLKPLLRGHLGLCLTNQDRIARLTLRWDAGRSGDRGDQDDPGQVNGETVIAVLGPALDSIRELRARSAQTVVSANMRAIGQGIYIYANNNKGAFPPDLATLIQAGTATPELFSNPYTGELIEDSTKLDQDGMYLYRAGLNWSSAPGEVLLAERVIQNGMNGAIFLFVDSHVEFVAEPEASELISRMMNGEAEIRLKSASGR